MDHPEHEPAALEIPTLSGLSACAICLLGAPGGPVLETTCGHPFHRGCLAAWSKRSATCPMCKRALARALAAGPHRARGAVLMVSDVDPANPDTWPSEKGGIAVFGEEEVPPQVWRRGATVAVREGPSAGVAAALDEWRRRVGISACASDRQGAPVPGVAAVAVRGPAGLRAWEPADPETVIEFRAERAVTGILDALQKICNGQARFAMTPAELRAVGDPRAAAVGGFSEMMEWRYLDARDEGPARGQDDLRSVVARSLARDYTDMMLS